MLELELHECKAANTTLSTTATETNKTLQKEIETSIKLQNTTIPFIQKSLEQEIQRTTTLRNDVVVLTEDLDRTHRLLREENVRVDELRVENEELAASSGACSLRNDTLIDKYEMELKNIKTKHFTTTNQSILVSYCEGKRCSAGVVVIVVKVIFIR